MIDFGALVLGPAMAVFGQAITVTPVKSQPGVAAYDARGVYALKPVEVPIEGTDLVHQSFQDEIAIRLSAFTVAPKQGDTIARTGGSGATAGSLPDGTFEIFNVVLDGQGGATLVLRTVS